MLLWETVPMHYVSFKRTLLYKIDTIRAKFLKMNYWKYNDGFPCVNYSSFYKLLKSANLWETFSVN